MHPLKGKVLGDELSQKGERDDYRKFISESILEELFKRVCRRVGE